MEILIQPVPQTVTVTDNVAEVLHYDLHFFNSFAIALNQNKLLNLIVQNYSGSSPADFIFHKEISRRKNYSCTTKTEEYVQNLPFDIIERFQEAGQRIIVSLPEKEARRFSGEIDEPSENKAWNIIENGYKRDFFAQKNKPIHGRQIRFTLTKKSVEKLLTVPNIPHNTLAGYCFNSEKQDIGYKTLTKYLARLFEGYANLSVNEREKILFSENYRIIQDAIDKNCCLTVNTEDLKLLTIKPYGILLDNSTGYNYLIGYSSANNDSNFKPATFRIYRLYNLLLSEDKTPLNYTEKEAIRQRLTRVSPAYFNTDAVNIRVLLNEIGMQKFNIILRGRPTPLELNKGKNGWHEFTFCCTEFQAKTYFFKFGADAVVIEPKSLNEEMKRMYLRAVEMYQDY